MDSWYVRKPLRDKDDLETLYLNSFIQVYKADEVDTMLKRIEKEEKRQREIWDERIKELEEEYNAYIETSGFAIRELKEELFNAQQALLTEGRGMAQLRKALEFYADKENYEYPGPWKEMPVIDDGGRLATEALVGGKRNE